MVAHPLLETLGPGFRTPRCGPSGAHHGSPAFSLTVLLPLGWSPTSCLPWNPLRNYGSQNILEVLHHFTIKRSEIEPMKKTKIASRKMASTAGFLPPAILQPHIRKPWGHLAACLSFIPHRRPGRGSSRTAGPEKVHRAQPARKRFILHSQPGRGSSCTAIPEEVMPRFLLLLSAPCTPASQSRPLSPPT